MSDTPPRNAKSKKISASSTSHLSRWSWWRSLILRVVQGASTITMQLARNSYPGLDDKSLHRKLVEVMLARRIEHANSKDQILEHYMNRIFLGNGLFGNQRAA